MLSQQLHGVVNEVVEVKGSGILQLFFVGSVNLGRNGTFRIPCRGAQGLFGADKLILPAAHLVDGALHREEFIVDAQLFIDRFHHTLGVVGVVDGEAAGVADLFSPAAQDPHTRRVEGGGEHLVSLFAAQHIPQTLLQFPGRLVCEGDGHHVPAPDGVLAEHPVQPSRGIGAGHDGHPQGLDVIFGHLAGDPVRAVGRTEPDEVRDAVDQNRGLSASGTGQDQQRAVGRKHRLALHLV